MTGQQIQPIAELRSLLGWWSARLDDTAKLASAAAVAYPGRRWAAHVDRDDENAVAGYSVVSDPGFDPVLAAGSLGPAGAAVVALVADRDPAQVLKDVAADRALLEAFKAAQAELARNLGDEWQAGLVFGLRSAARIRAAVYAGCPGYQPEWAP